MIMLLLNVAVTRTSTPEILQDARRLSDVLMGVGVWGACIMMMVAGFAILNGELRLASRDWLVRHWMPLAAVAGFIVASLCISILSHLPNSWADGFNP